MSSKSNFDQIKKGDYLSEIQYYEVMDVASLGIRVKNERGLEFTISKGIVEEGLFSASQITEEKIVTRTELVEAFQNAGETVFTANFNKKPDFKELKEKFNDPNQTVKTIKAMERLMLGEERTMIGCLKGQDKTTGRFIVQDLEDKKGLNKQVDPRTLNWLILRNIRYTVKS